MSDRLNVSGMPVARSATIDLIQQLGPRPEPPQDPVWVLQTNVVGAAIKAVVEVYDYALTDDPDPALAQHTRGILTNLTTLLLAFMPPAPGGTHGADRPHAEQSPARPAGERGARGTAGDGRPGAGD